MIITIPQTGPRARMIASAGEPSTPRKRTVLVIDHDPEVLGILEVNLAHANLGVITARNGLEALIKASTERPDIILLDDEVFDLENTDICWRLKELQQASHIPLIVVGTESKKRTAEGVDGPDNYVTKPFDPKEVVALVETCLKQRERVENVNPLTGLSNLSQVNSEITNLIERNGTFAAIYVDLDNLKTFNKVYGFAQGDRAIRLVAAILCESVRLFGNPDDLVGHVGGDNFVIISTSPKARLLCQRLITDFDSRIRTLYKREDLERGYIEYESQLGQKEPSPIMSIRAAVVSNTRRKFRHHVEVSEAAAEQMSHLRHFPGSNYCFDLGQNDLEPELSLARGVLQAHREEQKTLQGVLAWVTFLARELEIPITGIKDYLDGVDPVQAEDFTAEQRNKLKTFKENMSQLVGVAEELRRLTRDEWVTGSAIIDEVDLRNTVDWIMKQTKELAIQRRIEVDSEGVEDVGQLVVDGRGLTQALFYALRSEIEGSMPGDRVHIRVYEKSKSFVTIELINRNHIIAHRELSMLFQGQLEGMLASEKRNDLYLAKVLVQGLGGRLSIESEVGQGTTFSISIPRRWQSSGEEINALLSAAETSKQEAQAQLDSTRQLLSSTFKQMPMAIRESLENLGYKIQELRVLCNRSLFLADDLSNRLETQQDQLLRQEVAQFATLEAILAISREIARSMHLRYLFDIDSAQRVARYALVIADKLGLTRNERQALHYAALLKDLGLVLSPEDAMEQMVAPTLDKAIVLRARFNLVWKALSAIEFLSPALILILHRYERYDGADCLFSASGDNIPLGARILAVADTFDAMTSGPSPQGTIDPEMAVQKLIADSGQRFDPHVVSAFAHAQGSEE